MTPEEVKSAYEELKKEGMSEDDIAMALGKLYENGEISKDELGALLEPLGKQLKPEFKEMGDEEAKKSLWGEADGEEETEELEEAGEGDIPGAKEDEPESDEADEKSEAMRLMNLKK